MALSERLSYPWTTPFVGRQRELAQLVRQLDEAERGRCSIVLLTGEPGIGKTRLAEELCATAEESDAIVIWGECFEGEGAPAFWPWVQVLRAWVRSQSPADLQSSLGEEASDVAQIVPELRTRMPGLPEPASLPPTQARFRLFDSIVTVLQRMATRPLVLVLDDLHWADEPSLLLLEFLAAQLFDAPILVIEIYRDVEVAPGNALSTTLGGLLRRPRIGRVVLGRLSPDEVAELVEVMPGIQTSARLAQAVLDRAEGNPLFVAEMLRLLDAERTDVPLGADADRVVPPTIQDVIGRRLNKLSETCRSVLTVASVIGREFDLITLRTVCAEEDERAVDALDEAEAVRIVAPTSGGPSMVFRFMHALVRDTLYEALPASRRARLHLRVGTAIERMAESRQDVRHSELAHHFVQAASMCRPARVVGHVERAARHAVQILAYEDAARLYAVALRVLETSPRPDLAERCELLLQLGAVQSSMTDDTAARKTFMAAALARQLEPTLGRERAAHLLAQAALGYGGARLEPHRVDARGINLFEEALAADDARRELDLLTADDFAELRHGGAWNYSITFLSQLCADLDDRARAAELYEMLLPQERFNVVSGITFVSCGAASLCLARLAATLDRPEAAARHFEDALQLHERLQARPLLADTRYRYAVAILDQKAVGTREQAHALAQLAADDAAEVGMPVLHQRSAALLDGQAPAQPPDPATVRTSYPDGLTGREIEVLSLLAAGASNVEIARALVLSPGTIHTHTIRIYQKLGIKRRAEAAAYAVRHGFVARTE